MNAPFQARAGLRDPFTAFVCDDATAGMLRPVAVEHGWSPEKVHKGGLRNAVQSLSVSASPNILFVDLSESADPLNDIWIYEWSNEAGDFVSLGPAADLVE